jgi:hypothetical protein
MPSKSPQRLAKLAKAEAARNPPLTVECNELGSDLPGVQAAAKSTILELMNSKGFTQANAIKNTKHYVYCFGIEAVGMRDLLTEEDEAVCKMVGDIFFKHYQSKAS